MTLRYTPARWGQNMSHLKRSVTSFGRAIHHGVQIFKATKAYIPDSRMKDAASKGVTSYEGVVEKLRAGGL
jgi:hypothetical protein